jgi:hypothetical protein
LRCGTPPLLDNSADDAFLALRDSNDVEVWKWASSELPTSHPVTGDTVFHLLCRTDKLMTEQKLAVLGDLKAHYRNPLVPNYRNEVCIDLTKDTELKKVLGEYMCWQPHKLVMEWFGPCFRRRAWTLLLVCYRMKKEHPKALDGLNKDMRHLLVKHLSRVEYLYVPYKQ